MAALFALSLICLAGVAQSTPSSRIIGGTETAITDIPYIVQVESRGIMNENWNLLCGGSVLTTSYILSSAECFHGSLYNSAYRRIRAGTASRTGGTVVYVDAAINHPSFDSTTFDEDITVVRLVSTFSFSTIINQGVIVASGFELPVGTALTIAGWGSTTQGGPASSVLRSASVVVVSATSCQESYNQLANSPTITDNMFCTGTTAGGVDFCQGDVGGPVVVSGIIVGIKGWNQGCGNAAFPAVSTKVAAYTDWILSTAV